MSSIILEARKMCIYCGSTIGKMKKGEHVVPEALGCRPTIKCVCQNCNEKVLSPLDRELISESPLKYVVWEELGRNSESCWDYHEEQDLALEAHPGPRQGRSISIQSFGHN